MKFKVAVVQFRIGQFRPEINLKRSEKFIKYASKRADIIVFPEDFLTGPILKDKGFVDFYGKYLKYFKNLAKKYSIDIIPGSWIEGSELGLFNTSYYIDRNGKVRGKYRKTNLWLAERKYLTAGNEICIFNTRFGKAALIICWDLMFPEIFRMAAKGGVKIIYCPSFWLKGDAGIGIKYDIDAEIKMVNSLCVARACENEIIVVYCNAAGKYGGKDELIGRSQITMPFLGAVKRLEHNKEKMFIMEINTSILMDAEKAYRIRRDLKKRIL